MLNIKVRQKDYKGYFDKNMMMCSSSSNLCKSLTDVE